METKEVHQIQLIYEQKVHKEYMQALKEEEITWRLNSRSLWLKEGDKIPPFIGKQNQDIGKIKFQK